MTVFGAFMLCVILSYLSPAFHHWMIELIPRELEKPKLAVTRPNPVLVSKSNLSGTCFQNFMIVGIIVNGEISVLASSPNVAGRRKYRESDNHTDRVFQSIRIDRDFLVVRTDGNAPLKKVASASLKYEAPGEVSIDLTQMVRSSDGQAPEILVGRVDVMATGVSREEIDNGVGGCVEYEHKVEMSCSLEVDRAIAP